jgi:hypothetical protein
MEAWRSPDDDWAQLRTTTLLDHRRPPHGRSHKGVDVHFVPRGRYRVVHTAALWKGGERPKLKTAVVEGDVGLAM